MQIPVHPRIFFGDQPRAARANAAADSEQFPGLLFAFERMGGSIRGEISTLSGYRGAIADLASASILFKELPSRFPQYHIAFRTPFEYVREARNEALHQGAYARTMAAHATQMALTLEDALMGGLSTVADFMVRNPTIAYPWQPVSFVRQQMLANGYSLLPMAMSNGQEETWYLLSESAVARYLRKTNSKEDRDKRLLATVQEAYSQKPSLLSEADTCDPRMGDQ